MSYRPVTLVWLAIPLLACAAGAEEAVWRLGAFDHSSAEFRGGNPRVVAVDANAPDAAAHWPAMQAGSRNAGNQARAVARTIAFTLPAVLPGSYSLDFAIMLGYPRVPYLRLELNGAAGLAYLDRQLSYHAEGRMDSPVCGEARTRIPVPSGLLRAGRNELRITAIDDQPDENGDSFLEWDALQLLRDDQAGNAAEPVMALEPEVFYTAGNGGTNELVALTISLPAMVRQGSVRLTLAGAEYRGQLTPERFGQQRFEYAVPEFAAGATARMALDLNGRTYEQIRSIAPKRKFTVYIVPNTHLDIGFTDYQPKIEELQNRNLDKLLDEMRRDPDMRFSLDGAWLAGQFLGTRSPQAGREFMDLVRGGRIGVPAQSMNLMLGGANLETMLRSLTCGAALNRQAGRPAEYANITDVPAYPWAYASVLHAAGVKYFAAGANDDRGPQPLYGRWQTRSPFWWEGPDGAKILMSYNRQYSNLWFVCGLPAREAGCRASLPAFLQTFEAPTYLPDTVLMYGSQLENTDLIPGEGEFVRAWNARYAWPRLKLAAFPDYFHLIERQYGARLETVRGDFGPYWEDGIGTDARFAAAYRRVESRAAAVEKLSSLAALQSSAWAPPTARLHRLWDDLVLYAEHTYTYHGGYDQPDHEQSVRQIETKRFHVTDAREQAYWIEQESFSRLLDRIAVRPPALVVFNSLGHARDGLVESDLPGGAQLVDLESRKAVPMETLHRGNGFRHVRFLAVQAPSMGYRVYQVVRGAPAADQAAQPDTPRDTIENAYYRVRVNPARGGVESVFDKQLGRELIDGNSPYLANQYVYVAGGEGSRIVHMRDSLPAARLTVSPAAGGQVASVTTTNWGRILAYTTQGLHAPEIASEVRLFDGEKKIEFVNRFHKDPVNTKEAIYFAFPFAAAHPAFAYEGESGIVDPARDELPGGNREWYTVGHWMRVTGGGLSAAVIPLDAPLANFGDINRGLWPKTFAPASAAMFSYVVNNYWHTNFPRVQEGDFTFRYVLTSGARLNPEDLSRMGREALTPLQAGQLDDNDKVGPAAGALPAGTGSFLSLDAGGVEIEALKPAEDGNGYVLRLLETAGRAGDVRIASALLSIDRAWLCTALEQNIREIPAVNHGVRIAMHPFEIVTVRLIAHPRATGSAAPPPRTAP